jgi:hypothetical protein
MKHQEPTFSKFYSLDEATNFYMIEVAIAQYSDIFSEWDPAPFKRRDLDPDLDLYLEGGSEEIPAKYPIELCFLLPKGSRDAQVEDDTRVGLNNSFVFKLYLLRKEIKKVNAHMFRCLLLGFLFLTIGTIFPSRIEESMATSILIEGIFIGGWVFLWEAVSVFFFSNRELYHKYRIYKRLQNAPVIFREIDSMEL